MFELDSSNDFLYNQLRQLLYGGVLKQYHSRFLLNHLNENNWAGILLHVFWLFLVLHMNNM